MVFPQLTHVDLPPELTQQQRAAIDSSHHVLTFSLACCFLSQFLHPHTGFGSAQVFFLAHSSPAVHRRGGQIAHPEALTALEWLTLKKSPFFNQALQRKTQLI